MVVYVYESANEMGKAIYSESGYKVLQFRKYTPDLFDAYRFLDRYNKVSPEK